MTIRWAGSALFVFLGALTLQAQSRESLLQSLATIPSLQLASAPHHYSESEVEAFSAELAPSLRLYGVRGVTRQQAQSDGRNVEITFYEMLDSEGAYGLFTSRRGPDSKMTPTAIGTESFQIGGRLYFWQSKFVTVIEGPGQERDRLARTLSQHIRGDSRKPPVAEHLPQAHIVPGSEKYVLSPDGVAEGLAIDRDSLGFDVSVEAASASYALDGRTAELLLLLYPTHHLARLYTERMESTSSIPAGFWKRDGPLLAIVYGSRDENLARTILDGANHAYKVTYDENANPVTEYAAIILTVFKLLGVVLVFSIVGGVAFAGIRIFVKKRYPDRVFDRYQDIEIIQLKLDQQVARKEIEQ